MPRYAVALALLGCLAGSLSAQSELPAHSMPMSGLLGPYAMTREASGTSWQPEATPMAGIHQMSGDWLLMAHGFANMVFDQQGGPRGGEKIYSASMLMGMASRPWWIGTFGARGMVSLDPAMGPSGYPLLLQTGETSNGREPLIDRQHPHDLLMELAVSYSWTPTEETSSFVYFGLPGEPALGPPVFMHRFSGMDNPETPITHHWLDATHITYGVATVGASWKGLRLESSVFNGREPDVNRWDMDTTRFDSYSLRLSFNPSPDWAFQLSDGHLDGPEELDPNTDTERTTASAMYTGRLGGQPWQTTFAWGRNRNDPGRVLDGFLLESAIAWEGRHTFFGRAERVDKDELFQPIDPGAGQVFTVNKISLGYVYDFLYWRRLKFGVGGLGSVSLVPASLYPAYGRSPLSFMVWLRAKLL